MHELMKLNLKCHRDLELEGPVGIKGEDQHDALVQTM